MSELAIRQPSANHGWPMTGEAWHTLVDEAVLGCGAGDSVEVLAPAGRRIVTVLSVE